MHRARSRLSLSPPAGGRRPASFGGDRPAAGREAAEDGRGGASPGYDNDGLLTQAGSQTLARDTTTGLLNGTTLGSVSDSYGYDGYGAVQTYAAKYGSTTLLSESYTRDALGRIATKTETVQGTPHTYGYTYDLVGRLTDVTIDAATGPHYSYDSNGNRLSRASTAGTNVGTYDNQDRMLSYGASTYAYGANGELASKTAAGQTTNFTYDVLGNLKRVSPPGGPAIDYLVDGQGRRIAKKVNDVLVKGYIWMDALRIAAELDGAGNLVSRFVYGTRGNVPEYMVRGADTYRIVTDHLGSVRLVVKVSDGSVVQRIDYDEFGVVTSDTSPGLQPFGFAGGLYDSDTKLVRFGRRDYAADVGRWTAKDPVRFRGGINLYAYVGNDPLNATDPKGLGGAGGQSDTGGPWHPPPGTPMACSMADSCSDISRKIDLLDDTIDSHQDWDQSHGVCRHGGEIDDLTRARANCVAIHQRKCVNQPQPQPAPQPQPNSIPEGQPIPIVPLPFSGIGLPDFPALPEFVFP